MLADSNKIAEGLRIFKSGDQVTFQGSRDAVAESRKLGTFIPRDFGSIPGEFGLVGGEVAVAFLDSVELSLGILDTVGVTKGVFKDLDRGS